MRGERLQPLLAHLGEHLLARRAASRSPAASRRNSEQVHSWQCRPTLGDQPGDRGVGRPGWGQTSDLAAVLGNDEGLPLLDLAQEGGEVLTQIAHTD